MEHIVFKNDGPHIVGTSYWTSTYAATGKLFLSWNAGAARLLVPQSCESWLTEMRTAQYVIVSVGYWYEANKKDAFEKIPCREKWAL